MEEITENTTGEIPLPTDSDAQHWSNSSSSNDTPSRTTVSWLQDTATNTSEWLSGTANQTVTQAIPNLSLLFSGTSTADTTKATNDNLTSTDGHTASLITNLTTPDTFHGLNLKNGIQVLYGICIFSGIVIVMNCILLVASKFTTGGKSSTLIFIRSLCLSDMLIGIFGLFKCILLMNIDDRLINCFLPESLFISASTTICLTLLWLNIDSYLRLAKPLGYITCMDKHNVIITTMVVWNAAFITGFLPQMGWCVEEFACNVFHFYSFSYITFVGAIWVLCIIGSCITQFLLEKTTKLIQRENSFISPNMFLTRSFISAFIHSYRTIRIQRLTDITKTMGVSLCNGQSYDTSSEGQNSMSQSRMNSIITLETWSGAGAVQARQHNGKKLCTTASVITIFYPICFLNQQNPLPYSPGRSKAGCRPGSTSEPSGEPQQTGQAKLFQFIPDVSDLFVWLLSCAAPSSKAILYLKMSASCSQSPDTDISPTWCITLTGFAAPAFTSRRLTNSDLRHDKALLNSGLHWVADHEIHKHWDGGVAAWACDGASELLVAHGKLTERVGATLRPFTVSVTWHYLGRDACIIDILLKQNGFIRSFQTPEFDLTSARAQQMAWVGRRVNMPGRGRNAVTLNLSLLPLAAKMKSQTPIMSSTSVISIHTNHVLHQCDWATYQSCPPPLANNFSWSLCFTFCVVRCFADILDPDIDSSRDEAIYAALNEMSGEKMPHGVIKEASQINNFPTPCEWLKTVWNTHEKPRQTIAPTKKAENTAFSCHWISNEGRHIRRMTCIHLVSGTRSSTETVNDLDTLTNTDGICDTDMLLIPAIQDNI
ncbi:hypothetical protein MAR_010954 [Mya arenaria]|uniref:G-protein coupled receptors family 1 profile domain-containing protein n=1 Tax=Mya arenaria TaxID=6604 RepID=A0ABY7FSQ6_MYAAR|nr:hypothetical protein MAR_010954 [Mya arenaria]